MFSQIDIQRIFLLITQLSTIMICFAFLVTLVFLIKSRLTGEYSTMLSNPANVSPKSKSNFLICLIIVCIAFLFLSIIGV